VQLDLLANGGCDQMAFLQSMQQRFQHAPDATWEVLSQLDQYYRRGKIKPEMFQAIKTALAESALGQGSNLTAHVAAPEALGEARPRAKETPATAAAPRLKPGDKLRDRYRIEGILGEGGMGTVFEAVDDFRLAVPPSGQRLAIKVLHTAVTKRAELFAELRREFQNLQLLSHPNIVRVYEFDRDGPLAFFTMELLNGALLSRVLLSRKPLRLEHAQSLAVIRDVSAAIAHAHSRGVVHGDINPQNIFITARRDLRVLDFGASNRLLVEPSTPDDEIKPARFATPGYASCQVLEGKRPDARDDVFALACVAYRLLCGEHPFSESSALEARAAGSRARKPEGLTHRQWRVLQEGLHWDREMRPGDVQNWMERLDLRGAAKSLPALTDLLDPPPAAKRGFAIPQAKVLPAALGLLVALALAAGGYWFAGAHKTASRAITTAPTDNIAAARTGSAERPLPPAAAHEAPLALADSRPAAAGESAVAPQPAALPQPTLAASASPAPPQSARLASIEMALPTVEVPAGEVSARVMVRRKGNLRGEIGFTWWTESGTAKPGTDFTPVVPQVAHMGDRQTGVSLMIPLLNSSRTRSKSFYVVIDVPEGNAKLGEQGLAMVTLLPTG
jgi:eukaryotic-like serine/threonine-protein kinase